MAFHIVSGTGWLGTIVMVLMLGAAGILATFLFAAVKGARRGAVEDERDHLRDD